VAIGSIGTKGWDPSQLQGMHQTLQFQLIRQTHTNDWEMSQRTFRFIGVQRNATLSPILHIVGQKSPLDLKTRFSKQL
jgi:hypothetical protein